MNVLFYPRRRAPQQKGGDFIALRETLRALEPRGVRGGISTDATLDLTPYDVVHLYSLGDPYSAIPFALNAQRQHKPIVTTPIYWRHDQWIDARLHPAPHRPEHSLAALAADEQARILRLIQVEEAIYTGAHRFVIQLASRVLALSEMEREILRTDFGARPEQLAVTFNGVAASFAQGNAERFLQAHHIPARDFVLCVARVDERKNTIGLIRAWNREPVPLVLVGRAPNPAYLEMCRAIAGAHVYFLGPLSPADVADAGAAARVHIMASWWEEQGMAALEAALAGCNVVMTQNGPGREYFGDACFTCDPADESSIHAALCAALNAPRQPALAARVRERFTWDAAADILVQVYAQASREQAASQTACTNEMVTLSKLLCELRALKMSDVVALERQTHEQQAWIRELERIAATKNGWRNHPAARWVRQWVKRNTN
ncbi:MAG: glycosyltransferase family 4 protein [Chloroflexi bacterium]|nr:glycosyltransferase family 4 protein [Chloroflexota bacterium]